MSTILIYTSPARGHLYPMLDVALELRSRGHRVVVQTLADAATQLNDLGLEPLPIHPQIEQRALDDQAARSPVGQLRRTLACWADRAPFEIEDLRETQDLINPDLIVVDANTWGAAAFAESTGQRWAMFLPYCLPVPSSQTPAFGPGFAPPTGPLGRLRDRMVWAVQNAAARSALRQLAQLRRSLGVPPAHRMSDLYQRADVLLYRTAEPFEYPRESWPRNVRMIGPGLWAPQEDAPEWLQALPHPRVLVTVSTEDQQDARIVHETLAGLRDSPGSVIVTTAAQDPDEFSQYASERIRIQRFLPHAEVIPEVDVVVTHGGMGTVQRTLAAGVPVCVVPWGRDQSESAERVVQSRSGTRVSRARMSPRSIREGIERAAGMRADAQEVAQGFLATGGAQAGADELEAVLAEQHIEAGTGYR